MRMTPQKKKQQVNTSRPLSNFMKTPNHDYKLLNNNQNNEFTNPNRTQQQTDKKQYYYQNQGAKANSNPKPTPAFQQTNQYYQPSGNKFSRDPHMVNTAVTPSKPVTSNVSAHHNANKIISEPKSQKEKVKVSHIGQFIRGGRESIDNRVFTRTDHSQNSNKRVDPKFEISDLDLVEYLYIG